MFDIVSSLTGRIRSSTQDVMSTLAIYAVVGLFTLTAYVALLYALGLVISDAYGPLVAALSIAGFTILLALIGLLVVRMRHRRLERLRQLRSRSAAAAGSTAAIATIVPMMVRASPVGSLMAVAVMAYVLSRAGQAHGGDK
ncbi:MAG: hypothetical protein EOP18_09745 [Rhizobiaceae bacterium]|nr:MAG: hypothetical protein EOP18_09745 [Rhizobiaceae bacterium]